ncbi:uncharacterized protein N7500_007240 [Penicillium coprophilum]|uniref:uncharacterized protein n=1 Tax=Penicillium coprophilum TaxID=36646 RepID=UPI00239D11CE|nr:uncharacterized protein N7500_007240 [Penicillium coprophilum]KAJ5165410.1 hypothetical protein N7500_007240 [Penicillium coprophilum]
MAPSYGALEPGGLFSENGASKVPSQRRACWLEASFSLWRTLVSNQFIMSFPNVGLAVDFGPSVLLAAFSGIWHRMIEQA